MRYLAAAVVLLAATAVGVAALTSPSPSAAPATVDAADPITDGSAAPDTDVDDPTNAAPESDPSRDPAPEREPRADAESGTDSEGQPAPADSWHVSGVVDGDTIDVINPDGDSERVRVIGIDTPERGVCGYAEASAALSTMVLDRDVELPAGAVDDRDRYGRVLRYVDLDGADAGLAMIEQGLAIARYDSRDGYGHHPREETYVAADEATPHMCSSGAPAPQADPAPGPGGGPGLGSGPDGTWRNCTEARDAGAAPVHEGDPGYGRHLDRDGDGIGCE